MKTEKNGFGASVYGIDAKAATPAVIAELKEQLYKNRLIVLKDQTVSEQ
jgi:(R)-3-[(carboxymethyl)amino]fatty acid dioxygenase/decarboxylase